MTNGKTKTSFAFGSFQLDVAEQVLLRDGREIRLTPKVFSVLCVLIEHRGHLVDKDTLLETVWSDSFVEEGALNRSISVLRKALGDTALQSRYIETVPKRGYRFIAAVTESPQASAHDADPHRSVGRRPPTWATAAVGVLIASTVIWYGVRATGGAAAPASSVPSASHRQMTSTGRAGSPTLSDDGARVAYISDDGGEKNVMVQAVHGDGEPVAIFRAPEVGHLRWSPDGTELIVWARDAGNNAIYVVSQFGGTPRRIVRNQYVACWSPDGATIAVGSYLRGSISFFGRHGEAIRSIALRDVSWSIWSLDWSRAHDRLLVVSSNEQGHYTVWTVRPNGEEQTRLFVTDAEIPMARWSADGDFIYYFRRSNQTMSLNKLPVRTSDVNDAAATVLISGLETDRSFAVSTDGTRLVYARAPFFSNLWVLDRTGGRNGAPQITQLTERTSLIERPHVSPGGTSIVFNMGQHPTAHLYTMAASGGNATQLTFGDSFNVGGRWSPDGTRIAFASTQGGTPRVWAVNTSGALSPTPLSFRTLSDTFDIRWSPDSRILYQRAGNDNYYDLDPLTQSETPVAPDPPAGWMFWPVYAPDGDRFAVMWNRPEHRVRRGLWLVDTRDRSETLIRDIGGMSVVPIGWSRNGASIYAVVGKPGTYRGPTLLTGETKIDAQIVEVDANSGELRPVAALAGQEIGTVTMTPDARRFYYTVYTSRSDVWVVDHFDASSTAHRRR